MKSNPDKPPVQSLPEPLEQLRAFMRDKKLSKSDLEADTFQELWSNVLDLLERNDPDTFWITIATLGRLAESLKPARRQVEPVLQHRLSGDLPIFARLSDGDDRYYLAKALEHINRSEIVDIAYQELAAEETAETARKVWAGLAGSNAETLSGFLQRLNSEIEAVAKDSQLSPDALCRRIRRITTVIDDYIAASDIDAGDELGRQLRVLFLGQLPKSGPEERTLREDASRDYLAALHKIVRLNFAARTDPQSYRLINEMRDWWRPASPNQDFEKAARAIARLGVATVLLFAKQGVKNKPLREAISDVADDRLVTSLAREFVARSPNLDEATAYWFVNGIERKEEKSIRAVDAISEAKLDEYIGRLLVALEVKELQTNAMAVALNDVRAILPDEAEFLEKSARRLLPVKQWANAIARARKVELYPEQLDNVRYDPTLHNGPDELVIGSEVRVLLPGALKVMINGLKSVLLKAEVE